MTKWSEQDHRWEYEQQGLVKPEAQGDVVERMLKLFCDESGATYTGDDQIDRAAMTAAARVLLDEALGVLKDYEWTLQAEWIPRDNFNQILAARRAHLLPEPKRDDGDEYNRLRMNAKLFLLDLCNEPGIDVERVKALWEKWVGERE